MKSRRPNIYCQVHENQFEIDTMKIFQRSQNYLSIFGIAPNQHPFNFRSNLSLAVYFLAIISIFIHIFDDVNTFQEYANSIFMVTAQIAASIIFTLNALRMQSFFVSLEEAEVLINGSEFKSIEKRQL